MPRAKEPTEAPKEGLVRMFIDPKVTDGGLTTNEKRYVGWVEVTPDVAKDLERRIEEISAIREFERNPRAHIYVQNSQIVENQYLADPAISREKKGFSEKYGLAHPLDYERLSDKHKADLKELRMQLYGY